jgi:hypothetical protein
MEVWVIAMPPVDASAEPAIETDTVRPLTVPATAGNDCELLEGPVGLPPQPVATPMASSPAAFVQHAQNSRRVGTEISSNLTTAVTSSGQRAA